MGLATAKQANTGMPANPPGPGVTPSHMRCGAGHPPHFTVTGFEAPQVDATRAQCWVCEEWGRPSSLTPPPPPARPPSYTYSALMAHHVPPPLSPLKRHTHASFMAELPNVCSSFPDPPLLYIWQCAPAPHLRADAAPITATNVTGAHQHVMATAECKDIDEEAGAFGRVNGCMINPVQNAGL